MNETLPDLKKESTMATPDVVLGFTNAAGFAMLQRAGNLLASAGDMIPATYRGKPEKCAIALEMANRIGVHFLAVMQNLYDVHGRPAWSSQFMTAAFNATPGFSKLRYEFRGDEGSDEWACRSWAIERETGERLEGSWISIALAKAEGWYGKSGSKWKTMPEQMLRYRASAWFVRAYAPELTMGLQTREEAIDTYDLEPANGGYSLPEAAPANTTAAILARAAQAQPEIPSQAQQDQPTAQPQDADQDDTPAFDATKKPKATAALRDEVMAMAEGVGLDVPAIEKEFGAYARNWTFAQCEEVRARASAAADQMAQEGEDAA